MKFSIKTLAAIGLMIPMCAVAGAEGINPATAVPSFFEQQVVVLENLGYTDVRDLGDLNGRVSASDAQGSRVIVSFNPDQATITRVTYLHFADK